MPEKTTISDIAEQSGVSIATVSLVLNGKPGVSQQTRTRVMEIAQSLGYPIKPPQPVRNNGRLGTLGMVVKSDPDVAPQANPFYANVISGIEEACRGNEISLLYAKLPVDANNHPLETPPMMTSGSVDGLLMVGTFMDYTITSLSGRTIPPIVLVDGYSDTESYDCVVSDNFQASYDAVEYLIRQGHQHIALVGGEADAYPSLRQRRNGYLRALKENGISTTYIADFNITRTKGTAETTVLLQANPQITAVFGINDEIAVAAMHAAQDLGWRVPDDLSVMGYDDIYLAANTFPPLTTMRVDTLAMGRAAVHLLQLRAEHPETARMTLVIHADMVIRDSVAPPAR